MAWGMLPFTAWRQTPSTSASISAAPSPTSSAAAATARRMRSKSPPRAATRVRPCCTPCADLSAELRHRTRRHHPLPARHDHRHQRGAGAQGREDRPDHQPRASATCWRSASSSARSCTGMILEPGCAGLPRARRAAPRGRRTGLGRGRGHRPAGRSLRVPRRRRTAAAGVEAIAVCFLFSFLHPAHELRTRDLIGDASSGHRRSRSPREVDPAFREYERTVRHRLRRLHEARGRPLPGAPGSRAGARRRRARRCRSCNRAAASAGTAVARQRPVRLFLSGPGGGRDRRRDGRARRRPRDLITIDIGGTSSDIALIEGGEPVIRAGGLIDGYTVRVPMVDVNAIGAGGGSIAWLDGAGGLRVGPAFRRRRSRAPPATARGGERADGDRCVGRARLARSGLFRRRRAAAGPARAREAHRARHRRAARACRRSRRRSASIAW